MISTVMEHMSSAQIAVEDIRLCSRLFNVCFLVAAMLASSHSVHILFRFCSYSLLCNGFLAIYSICFLSRQSLLPVFHIYRQKTSILKMGPSGGN